MSEEKESPPNLLSLVEVDTVVVPSEEHPALVGTAAAGFGVALGACAMGGLSRTACFAGSILSVPVIPRHEAFVTRNAAPPPISDIPARPKTK